MCITQRIGISILILLAALSVFAEEVIEIGPPAGSPDATFAQIQNAIDNNPGALLRMQAGTYDIGAHWLTVRHGITVEGVTDADGNLLTTVQGEDWIFHVRATGDYAEDDITLRHLHVHSFYFEVIVHAPFDFSTNSWLSGGGDLTIEECEITNDRLFSIWSVGVDGGSFCLRDSRIISSGNDAVRLENGSYRSVDISGNVIQSPFSGVEIVNFPGALPANSRSGPAYVVGNEIRAAFSGALQASIEVIRPNGPAFVMDNILDVRQGKYGLVWDSGEDRKSAHVVGNTFVGGDNDDGDLRVGVFFFSIFSPFQTGAKTVLFADNRFSGWWSWGVLVEDSSENNVFLHNDFTEADVAPSDAYGGGVHWAFNPFRGHSSHNSVTDNSGVEQSYEDLGTHNHFQGTSFLPAQAVGPHDGPAWIPAEEDEAVLPH